MRNNIYNNIDVIPLFFKGRVMKTCTNCGHDMPQSEFRPGRSKCKRCVAVYDSEKVKNPFGLVKRIYNNQHMTARKMGRQLPTYTLEELCNWLDAQPIFHKLYINWVNNGFDKNLVPSLDRKNNLISYTLDNIQVVTWRENLLNQKKQNISCEYLHTGSKAIDQFTLDNNFIQRFDSLGAATRHVCGTRVNSSNISMVAAGKLKTAYGFKWAWAPLS